MARGRVAHRDRVGSGDRNKVFLRGTASRAAELHAIDRMIHIGSGIGIINQASGQRRASNASVLAQIAEPTGLQAARNGLGSGNREVSANAVRLSRALVIAEEEQLVLDDRSSNRAAKLLPFGFRNEAVRKGVGSALGEGIASLKSIPAIKKKTAAMDLVAARARLGRNQTGDRLAKFGVVVLQRDLGFRYSVKVGVDDNNSQNRILVIGSVKKKAGAAEVLALGENLLPALRILSGSVAPSRQLLRTRGQELNLSEIAVQNGEILHILFVELVGDVGAIRFQLRRLGGDLDCLCGAANLELQGHARTGIRRDQNIFQFGSLEARSFGANGVCVRDQM